MEMVVCKLVTPDQKGSSNESQEVALSSCKWTPVVSLNLMITLLSSSVSEATMHFSGMETYDLKQVIFIFWRQWDANVV